MALPAGFDIGIAIATSGISALLDARLRLGAEDPSAEGAIDPQSEPLGTLGYRIQALRWIGAPDLGPAECWLVITSTPAGQDLSDIAIGLTLGLQSDAAGATSLGVTFREARIGASDASRSEVAGLVDQLEAESLLDVTSLLTEVGTALGVDLSTAGVSTGLLAATGGEEAIGVLVSVAGTTTFPAGAPSFIHPDRHIALAFGGPFLETLAIPAAIASTIGTLPAEIESGIELRSLDVSVAPDHLQLAGSGAHELDPGLGTVVFGGPIRIWYSQVTQRLEVDADEVDAAMPVSWLLVLLGPIGVFLAGWLDTTIDHLVRRGVRGAFGGLLGGFDPAALAPTTGPPVGTVVRWIAVEGGSLVIGASLHAGPYSAAVVRTSGTRRLDRIQLDDDDVLSVLDAAHLVEIGALDLIDVHVVAGASGRPYLRADPDQRTGNNLRSLPGVQLALIPPVERSPS